MTTNPYSSVSISGYNANPPDDDGSAVASNEIEWAKHKTKLGDPIKTAVESIDSNVDSAFAAVAAFVPSGVVFAYGGSTTPTGFLPCDGAAVSRVTHSDLFTVIGTTFGVGDGSTTFNTPDITGRVIAGKESSETRLTTAGSGINGGTLGAAGGTETHALITAELAQHLHAAGTLDTANENSHTHPAAPAAGGQDRFVYSSGDAFVDVTLSGGGRGFSGATTQDSDPNTGPGQNHSHTVTGSTANTGSGTAHQNTQPTIVLNYIIKT